MHASQRPAARQQQRVRRHAGSADAAAMFNLLTGPQLLERVEVALPEHRERLYPPTETLSMFVAQVLSADGSCQQAVDAAMVTRLIAGLEPGSTDTGAYCKARARLPVAMISTLVVFLYAAYVMPFSVATRLRFALLGAQRSMGPR